MVFRKGLIMSGLSGARLGLLFSIALAAPLAAQDISFDGVYRQGPAAACANTGQDGGSIEIKNNEFFGVESMCRMTRPVNVVDMDATLFDMKCQGEGTEWEARAMFMKAANGGLIMVWNGFAFQYDRCAASDLATVDSETAGEAKATESDASSESE